MHFLKKNLIKYCTDYVHNEIGRLYTFLLTVFPIANHFTFTGFESTVTAEQIGEKIANGV